MTATIGRVETELSFAWGRENPALFVQSVENFQKLHPAAEWEHSIRLDRPGFITLRATPKGYVLAAAYHAKERQHG